MGRRNISPWCAVQCVPYRRPAHQNRVLSSYSSGDLRVPGRRGRDAALPARCRVFSVPTVVLVAAAEGRSHWKSSPVPGQCQGTSITKARSLFLLGPACPVRPVVPPSPPCLCRVPLSTCPPSTEQAAWFLVGTLPSRFPTRLLSRKR